MTTKAKKPQHDGPDAPPHEPRPVRTAAEVTQAHSEALAKLAELKRAEPRDADAVLAQKLVVQGLAAELAATTE